MPQWIVSVRMWEGGRKRFTAAVDPAVLGWNVTLVV